MKAGVDLTEGPILKKFLIFAFPVLLSGMMQQLYNAADIMIVGNFADSNALAAVGATSSLTNLIINLFIGFSVGSNVLCARCYGAHDHKALAKSVHTSFLIAMILGIPLMLLGWFASKPFLLMMGTDPTVIGKSELYMKIFFFGAPAGMVFNYGAAMLRAVGDTKRPLYILAASGIVNVLINFVCVVFLGMDVVGVALGTIVAQYVSAITVLVVFVKNDSEIKLSFKKLKLHKNELKSIVVVGLPAGISSAMFSLSNVILQSSVNFFGPTVMAANSVACNYSNFAYILVAAGEQACTCFVGQNMGARRYDRIGRVVWIALLVTGAAMSVYSAVVGFGGRFFLGIFTKDANVIEYGLNYIYVVVVPYALIIPSVVLGGALRGMGYAFSQTVINLIFICFLRVLWVMFVMPLNNVYEMVFVSYPVSWTVAAIASAVVFLVAMTKLRHEQRR